MPSSCAGYGDGEGGERRWRRGRSCGPRVVWTDARWTSQRASARNARAHHQPTKLPGAERQSAPGLEEREPEEVEHPIHGGSTEGSDREVQVEDKPQATRHSRRHTNRPSAFEGIAHRIPRRRSRRAGKRRRATPREVHSDQTKRAVPTRDRRERLAVSHKLKIGKNVETRVSRFSRASARVLSLSTQTAAPCTYFHRLKHSKQCDPRRSSRCYSRGDGRRTRTRRTSTTLCSHSIYLRDKHRRRDGDDQGHHRASAVRRAGTLVILRGEHGAGAHARAWRAGRAGGTGGAPGPGDREGHSVRRGCGGAGGASGSRGSGRSRSGRTCRGRGGRGRRRETHLARKKECGGDGAFSDLAVQVTPPAPRRLVAQDRARVISPSGCALHRASRAEINRVGGSQPADPELAVTIIPPALQGIVVQYRARVTIPRRHRLRRAPAPPGPPPSPRGWFYVVSPYPSWPSYFLPQHFRVSSSSIAHV